MLLILIPILQRPQDRLQYIVEPQQHLVVPEPQDAESMPPEASVAPGVRAGKQVLAAVQFDHESRVQAGEVGDIGPDRMLASKAAAVEFPAAQVEPEAGFGLGHASAQVARERYTEGISHRAVSPSMAWAQASRVCHSRGSGESVWRASDPITGARRISTIRRLSRSAARLRCPGAAPPTVPACRRAGALRMPPSCRFRDAGTRGVRHAVPGA